MEISKIVDLIERFAPLDSQEKWDCSGFQIQNGKTEVKKILLCLSVTEDIVNQAVNKNCDMILAHHPLFFVPFSFNKGVSIYSAHTNMDKADGGTTDTLIELLDLKYAQKTGEFLRFVELSDRMSLAELINLFKDRLNLKTVRVVNNFNKQAVNKIAFCSGSGMDFLPDAEAIGADVFVTADVKYHQALESNVIIIDIGHFESEHPILSTFKTILNETNVEVISADEKSPFINY